MASRTLQGERLRIGRGRDNELCLDAKELSVYHAELQRFGDVVELCDLKSSNGTFLNGQRIARTVVNDGDLIGVGRHVIQACCEVPAGAPPEVENRLVRAKLSDTAKLPAPPPVRDDARARAHLLYQSPRWTTAQVAPMTGTVIRIGAGKDMDVRLWGLWVPRCMAMIVRGSAGYSLVSFAPDPRWVRHEGQVVEDRVTLQGGSKIELRELKAVFRLGPPTGGAA